MDTKPQVGEEVTAGRTSAEAVRADTSTSRGFMTSSSQ